MSKFAKYVPVEGEIRVGDLFKPRGGKIGKRSEGEPIYPSDQKYQLFLCSSDIQVGDMVKSDDNPERKFYQAGAAEVHRKEAARLFKVVGEVSPEATWVKADDTFTDDQIQGSYLRCLDCGAVVNSEEHSAWAGCTAGYQPFFKIKGPCGHFH